MEPQPARKSSYNEKFQECAILLLQLFYSTILHFPGGTEKIHQASWSQQPVPRDTAKLGSSQLSQDTMILDVTHTSNTKCFHCE